MSGAEFTLDPRLAADSHLVEQLPLCELRLMDDTRFGWLLLVPRRPGLIEITDLDDAEQALLWQETRIAACALRVVFPCDKLNLGALGNIVRQLHVHVVARCDGDTAWPGPVWGAGTMQRRGEPERIDRINRLRAAIESGEVVAAR